MVAISLAMIVKNEEQTLERCLKSVSDLVDEIVIVDTGSDDTTKAIARTYTPKIYDVVWQEDFALARNFSFSKATMDYILWLDADDVLKEDSRTKLLGLKHDILPSINAVSMPYHLAFDSLGHVTASLRRNRLIKRTCGFQWHGAVHEYLAVQGPILMSDITVTHWPLENHPNRNIAIFENRLNKGAAFTPRDWLYYAHELVDHRRYGDAIARYLQFLDLGQGWLEDNIATCGKLSDCYFYLGNISKSRRWALESFQYDVPRAEFCCRLGYSFIEEQRWDQARYWYMQATESRPPDNTWSLVNHASYTWLPHIQLSVCLSHLRQYQEAYQHLKIAAQYLPDDDPMVRQNRQFLQKTLRE